MWPVYLITSIKDCLRRFGRAGAKALLAFVLTPFALHVHAQALPKPTVTKPQVENPLRVLLIGNSYYYYNNSLHNHLKRMVAAGDPTIKESTIEYKSATISGASLAHHPVEWFVTPGQLGIKGGFELVVFADGSAAPLSESRRVESRRLLREHAATVRKHGAQVALYMTHTYAAPHRQAKPENLTLTARHYVEAANEIGALVIPVALAFEGLPSGTAGKSLDQLEAYERLANEKQRLDVTNHGVPTGHATQQPYANCARRVVNPNRSLLLDCCHV